MINIILVSLLFALAAVSFSLLLDVCLGRPAEQEYDPKAIFFHYSELLACRALSRFDPGTQKAINEKYEPMLTTDKPPFIRFDALLNKRKDIFEKGRHYFTWEKGAGMCPTCTNVRISIAVALFLILVYSYSWYLLIFIPSFSTFYLLIYNKLKN